MKIYQALILLITVAGIASAEKPPVESLSKPNLIYILCDDLGYGDISALNPEGKIPTPHVDRLAAEGMTFTDAHSSSSVCTPTRYNVLTGRYNWRTTMKSHVLNGYGRPLIAEDRLTLASLLRDNGYRTAMIGKWHLGMMLPVKAKVKMELTDKNGKTTTRMVNDVDWSKPIGRTPTSNGFDYFWGHGASLDFPPYNYIENDRYISQKVFRYPEEADPGCGWRRLGWIADNFDPYTTMDEFCDRTADYILKDDGSKPFFVYVPLTSPHTPIIPTEEWKGKSGIGLYGDFVMQTDAGVGRILKALDDKGYTKNTIVVFTSDNGCSKAANFPQLDAEGHHPNGIYRGSKADVWEGGHRVPHIIRWPAQIKAGTEADRVTVLGDIVATMADIVGAEIPENAAEDSVSFYPSLRGENDPAALHKGIINHSLDGEFAIRTKKWKLIFAPGSAGWTKPTDKEAREQGLPDYQLYDMENDPREQNNLIEQMPEVVKELTVLAKSFVVDGRSTPGEPQTNDTPNDWKQLHWMNNQ
jgi:arylsulfatase A-like enzyme